MATCGSRFLWTCLTTSDVTLSNVCVKKQGKPSGMFINKCGCVQNIHHYKQCLCCVYDQYVGTAIGPGEK